MYLMTMMMGRRRRRRRSGFPTISIMNAHIVSPQSCVMDGHEIQFEYQFMTQGDYAYFMREI